MTLPPLAPSADCPIGRIVPAPRLLPTDSEWATLHSELERLYVLERRKLRYIMRHMELKYGFKATQQMYKKRFAKWGMQKNSRRSATSTPSSTTTLSRRSSPVEDLGSIPTSPELGNDDSLMLMLLTNVQTWSVSFYESVQSTYETSASSIRQSCAEQSHEMNLTFKLVVDMLNRGHGDLAGRVARKAFLLVEENLMLEGPALVWNMLEIMHYMVRLHHWQLLQLLLVHLTALVDGRMPKSHPLPVLLQVLRVFVGRLPETMSDISKSLPTSPSSPTSLDKNEATTAAESWLISSAFVSIIERAWTLNAEILFDHFDDRLFQLYIRVHWDACSIEPPPAIIGAAKQWLGHMSLQQISKPTTKANQTKALVQITPFAEDGLLQRVFTTPMNASPPLNYNSLRISSIAALQDHANSILNKGAGFAGDTNSLLRILAGLVTATVLEDWSVITDTSNTESPTTSRILRGQAGNIACAVRTSIDLNGMYDRLETPSDTIKQIQSIVDLLEYSNAEADPRLIREMWLLEDALSAAGEHQKALDVKLNAYRRLETYVRDIPVSSA